MMMDKRLLLRLVLWASAAVYSAICLHSIEEIHYLKSFFPGRFTVEEAFYASAIELIKLLILGIPFGLLIVLCMRMSSGSEKSKKEES